MQHSCHDSFLQRLSKQVLRISSLLLLLKSATRILAILSQKKTAAISCLTACCLKYLNWAAQSGCDMTWMMTLDNSNWCSGRSVVNLTMQNILIILYYIVLGTISNYITWWGWGKLNLFKYLHRCFVPLNVFSSYTIGQMLDLLWPLHLYRGIVV